MIQNLDNEIWMPVVGYEGLYEVSNMGRVKTLERTYTQGVAPFTVKEAIKIASVKNTGYLRVMLSKNCKPKSYSIHRLVIIAFYGYHEILKEVNHKNGVKSDNRLENLEWSDRSKNITHSFRVLGRTNSHSPFKKGKDHILYGKISANAKKVRCETLGVDFPSLAQADKELGIYKGGVHEICIGKRVQINGLTFRYL